MESKGLTILQGCQNPNGCGKLAVHTVQAVRGGEVHDEVEVCAYCVDGVKVPRGFSKFVDGEKVTGDVQAKSEASSGWSTNQ